MSSCRNLLDDFVHSSIKVVGYADVAAWIRDSLETVPKDH